MLTFGSLFAGIGGFDLGLERAGMQCAWQVEIDPYAQRILAKHWPDVPRYSDIRDCGAHNLAPVDVLCGGFPCQDISDAGKRAGITGSRSGLWSEFARIISELRPRYVIVENVSDLLHRGIGVVLGDLATIGYDAEWSIVSACALGAPHTRARLFIVAYPNGQHGQARLGDVAQRTQPHAGDNHRTHSAQWLHADTRTYRMAHGVPHRMDRIRGLGNAIVPACAEYVGRCVTEHHRSRADVSND